MTEHFPRVQSIAYDQLLVYFNRLATSHRPIVFLDSVHPDQNVARYSYIAYDPFDIVQQGQALNPIISQYEEPGRPDLPPFQGGLAGYLSYDWCRELETLPNIAQEDGDFPAMSLGLFDLVLSFDHQLKKAWLIASGLPETDPQQRDARARQRQKQCWQQMHTDSDETEPLSINIDTIRSNFSPQAYQQAVKQIIEYIKAGDVFEVNLSQRFSATLPRDFNRIALYQRLRALNPAPFGAYIHLGKTAILSSSPERFLKLAEGHVEARPIKGTIRRSENPVEDQQLAQQLKNSDKDRAENTMIVDLMRNDLSRVCQPHTVHVPQYCGLESYANVHHLVSVIEGKLAAPYHAIDLLKATFPGGSITGAPKIRAMEIIETLEPHRRGPYCGSAVWIGFNGMMDSSILIRTYVIQDDHIYFHGGGAVVIDSDPLAEYQETLVKINRLHQALAGHDLITG